MMPFVSSRALRFSAWFVLRLSLALGTVHALLQLCAQILPEFGHRQVFFGTNLNSKMSGQEQEWTGRDGQWNQTALDERRLAVSGQLMDEVEALQQQKNKIKLTKWLSIGIVAAERRHRELTQVVAHLLGFWLLENGQSYELPRIIICNTMAGGRRFEALDGISRRPLGKLMRILDLNRNELWPTETHGQRVAKEAADYWKCLRKMAEENGEPEYHLHLEDDAVPIPPLRRALSFLRNKLNQRRDIEYVKLYHPWALRKYPWTFQALTISLLFGFLAGKILQFWRKHFTAECVLFSICVAFGTQLFIRHRYFQLFSTAHFALVGGPLLTEPEYCCTQAVLFRASSALAIAASLSKINATIPNPKDFILDDSPFTGRQTDSNLVVHIGWLVQRAPNGQRAGS